MLESKKYWIWFSLIKELGSIRKQKLLKIYKEPKNIYNLSKNELLKIDGIGNKIVDNICDKNIKENLDKYILYMKKTK